MIKAETRPALENYFGECWTKISKIGFNLGLIEMREIDFFVQEAWGTGEGW